MMLMLKNDVDDDHVDDEYEYDSDVDGDGVAGGWFREWRSVFWQD